MRLLSYNNDGRRVSISIAGSHQLTGARLCTGVSITKFNEGWAKLIWNQCVKVKSQKNSVISNFQVKFYGDFISDIKIGHRGKTMSTE